MNYQLKFLYNRLSGDFQLPKQDRMAIVRLFLEVFYDNERSTT